MSVVSEKIYTPEDLLAMPDGDFYELVEGHLVEKKTSALSSWVGGQLHYQINSFLQRHPLGWAWPGDQGYTCFPDGPLKVRKPDVTFIRRDRMPEGPGSEGYIDIPPDLAVEVVSPDELAYEVESKILEYLSAGVPLVWVIDPEARTARIHRRDGSASWLRESNDLEGEDVLPGFRCAMASIFPEKPREASLSSS